MTRTVRSFSAPLQISFKEDNGRAAPMVPDPADELREM